MREPKGGAAMIPSDTRRSKPTAELAFEEGWDLNRRYRKKKKQRKSKRGGQCSLSQKVWRTSQGEKGGTRPAGEVRMTREFGRRVEKPNTKGEEKKKWSRKRKAVEVTESSREDHGRSQAKAKRTRLG